MNYNPITITCKQSFDLKIEIILLETLEAIERHSDDVLVDLRECRWCRSFPELPCDLCWGYGFVSVRRQFAHKAALRYADRVLCARNSSHDVHNRYQAMRLACRLCDLLDEKTRDVRETQISRMAVDFRHALYRRRSRPGRLASRRRHRDQEQDLTATVQQVSTGVNDLDYSNKKSTWISAAIALAIALLVLGTTRYWAKADATQAASQADDPALRNGAGPGLAASEHTSEPLADGTSDDPVPGGERIPAPATPTTDKYLPPAPMCDGSGTALVWGQPITNGSVNDPL